MPEPILTIVFRGLMVFNIQGSEGNAFSEVGVLHTAPGHFLRINTVKNCVLDTVMPIKETDITTRDWQIAIDNPVEDKLTQDEPGDFDRKNPDFTPDFRWIIDLEDKDFYGPLRDKIDIDTSILKPVIRIPSGKLYTRLKSHALNRKKGNDQEKDFGFISAAVACDIKLQANSRVTLNAGGTEVFDFEFDAKDPHTIYEIVNSPPDITPPGHATEEPHQHGESSTSELTEANTHDHFVHYYLMFKDPNVVKFGFRERGANTGPRPALCGMVLMGERQEPL